MDENQTSGGLAVTRVTTEAQRQGLEGNSKQVLDSILNSIGSAIIVSDLSGKFLTFNPAAEKLFGVGATINAQDKWAEVYGMYDADGQTRLTEDAFPLVRAMRGESVDGLRMYIKNEKMVDGLWVSVNIRPLKDSTGCTTGGVIVIDDITNQIKLEQELRRSNSDLQQFAAVAAHDLQEPLRTVTSFLELFAARNKEGIDEKSVRYMAFIQDGVKRMQILIDDLLTYSRIQTRAKPFEPVDCNGLLNEVISNLNTAIKSSGATIEVEPLPVVKADREQLKQVFQNLLSNALKFKRDDDPPRVQVKARTTAAGNACFSVSDNGIGIKPEYYERIFGIFQRLHSIETYPGSGIGLSICKRVVERHNGVVSVESEPGKGTTFSFTLGA